MPPARYAIMRPGIVLSPGHDPVWTPETVSRLPPLESLRFFEAAARHESFARAASELGVTAAAVAYHVRALDSRTEMVRSSHGWTGRARCPAIHGELLPKGQVLEHQVVL